jgi:LAGLIDADG endonuclease
LIGGYAYHPKLFNQKPPKLVIDTSSLVTNAWFSGFAEGDGSFQIRATRGLKYRRTAISFELEQSQSTENLQVIMEKIARELTLSSVKATCQNQKKKWRVRSQSLLGHANLIAYFDKYPLYGTKIQDYLDWRTVYQIIKNKQHLHEEGFAIIERIKSGMNNKRIPTQNTSNS